ncbi:uncharacterized protein LOC131893336 [Tigriopus californicus]|uniref:uncharacterized protein LOC131893336 n=1 Tax=Tigriopus californicus TaxID=6832 RepID=UPI0027DA502E|nr:uncharacterized protein LOC131893336 [Tigriopus californicus]
MISTPQHNQALRKRLLGTFKHNLALRKIKMNRGFLSISIIPTLLMSLVLLIVPILAEGEGRNLDSHHQNPYQSRGASLVYEGPHSYHQQSYPPNYFFSDHGPAPVLQRRQRQFEPDRFDEPLVAQQLRAVPHQEEVKVEIRELPPRPKSSRLLSSPLRPQQQTFSSFFNAAQPVIPQHSFTQNRFAPFGRSLSGHEEGSIAFTQFVGQHPTDSPDKSTDNPTELPTDSPLTLFHPSPSHMKAVPAVPVKVSQDSSIQISHPTPTLSSLTRPPLSTQATSFASFSMVHLNSGPGVQPSERPDILESKVNLNRARQPVRGPARQAVPDSHPEEDIDAQIHGAGKTKPIKRVVVTRVPTKAARASPTARKLIPSRSIKALEEEEPLAHIVPSEIPSVRTTARTGRTKSGSTRPSFFTVRRPSPGTFRKSERVKAKDDDDDKEEEIVEEGVKVEEELEAEEEEVPTVPTVSPTTRTPKVSPLFSKLRARSRGATFFRKGPRHNRISSSTSATEATTTSSSEEVSSSAKETSSTESTTKTTTITTTLPSSTARQPPIASRLVATRASFRSRGSSNSPSAKPNRIVVKGQRRKSAPESTSTTPVKETPRALTGSRFSARKSLLDLRPAFRAIKAKNSPKEKKEEEEEETEDDDDDDDDDDATEEPEISTHRSEEILASLRLSTMKTPSIDPCLPNNHKIVQDQPQRSINHHLAKSGDEPPICDRDLERGWYRFESAAGNIMPTECPGGNYCGTNMPIWMKGDIPSEEEGTVEATGCINRDRECCINELPMQVRNCSKFIVYHLEPTPTCSMGYCIGEGVPCPEGLTSENGYTPCNFTAKLDTVVLSPQVNDNHTEVTFSCQPVIQDAIDRATISVEIEWWVGNMLVSDETFELKDRPSGVLSQDLWKVGHEVRCTALVMHTVTGSGTEKKSSKTFFIGLVVDSETSLILHEGGVAQDLKISSTIPITCPDGRRGRHCCLDLELSEKIQSSGQRCPNRETLDRLAFPLCKPQICEDDFNSSVSISLRVKNDHLINGNETIHLEIGVSGVAKWKDYKLPDQQLQVVSSDVQEFCQISSFLTTFDGSQVQLDQPGIYTIYRHQSKPIEIQAHFFPCSLSKLCTCAVSVRVGDIFMVLDVCTKGHLQVWASTESGTVPDVGEIPRGLELLSVDEGREYRILLPTGGYVSLGSLLTSLRIYASQEDLNQTSGLCGPFNRNIMDDFMKPNGEVACTEKSKLQTGGRFKQPTPKKALKCVPFTKSWSLERKETLFAGYFDKTLNGTLPTKAGTCSCNKQHDKRSSLVHENIEDIGENFEVMDCYAEDLVCFQQQNSQPFLTKAFALGKSPDFRHFTDLIVEPTKVNVESDESVIEQKEVAQIILSTSVQSSHTGTPPEGWTLSTADKHCANFIQESDAADRCRFVPEMDLSEAIQTCRTDLLFTGNFRVATLHLERLKEECRESLFRNTSLWTLESGSSFLTPPRRIADALCLNDCSGNGICDRGTCKCDSDYIGGDCSQTLSTGIHTSEPPPPQVSALTNFGLCDTRTKPCRELTVLGDGLVNHEALKCNLEIYKIRGVASKQLVTDLVMTMPAKFISYQQVLCPLPELDIHHPDDLAKLDFKDNTDHTRIFAKVSLSYGQGPRSAPLDLLLYDSLCWDCDSAGECTAKTKETRCFFAAGTSSIQVFRIGRTISTRVSPDDFRTCTLPKDSGGCDNKIFRYYYNAIERRCKLFVYGGCKGNGNNFLSEIQCLQQCGDESALALLPEPEVTTEIDTCSQIKDEGICTGYVPRFYFNKKLGRCELFSYGGCGGNNNNFESEDNCVAHCGGPSGGGIFSHSTDVSLDGPSPVTIRKSKCNLPLHKGACHATLRRFFFDSDEGRCKLFIFGGCQGNANNFETMEECIEDCSGPNFMNGEKTSGSNIIISTTTLEPTSKPTSLSGSNFQTTNVCELTKSFGTCLTVSFRYFYDFATNTCKRFRYSGCGGNGNNFLSAADCVRTCGGVLAGDKRAPELKVSPRFYETIKHRAEGEIGGYIRSTSTTTTSSTIKPTTMPTTTTVFVESTTTNPPASTAERSTRLRVKQRKRFFPAAITAATTTSIKSTTEPSTIIHKTTTARHHIVRATPIPRGRSRFGTGVRARFVALSATTSTPKPDTETKDEGMMVSTQTSRSTIVRAKPKRPISNDIHGLKEGHDSDESPTPSELMASTGHAHHRFKLSSSLQRLLRSKASDRSNKLRVSTPSKSSSTSEEGEDRETPFSPSHDEEEDPNQTDLSSTSLEASASELRPTTVFRGTNSLFSRRISKLSHVPVIDQVVKAPLTMKGSELVVIHTFCRHSPPRGSQPRCNREKPLYFYNVTSATCEPFYDGYCGRSRNRFPSKAACLSSCIVASENVDSAEAD